MRISRGANCELVQEWSERFKLRLRLPQGLVKGRLVSSVERRKIDGLHSGVELAFPLGFAVWERRDHWTRRQNLRSQGSWVRAACRRLNAQPAFCDSRIHFRRVQPHGKQEFLAGLRMRGERNRLLCIVVAAGNQRAV